MEMLRGFFTEMGRFFRKHDRLVSSFSLLILLGTFLSKEYFRDDAKDRAGAIASAEPMFFAREQMADVKRAVDEINQTLSSRFPRPKPTPPRLSAKQRREIEMQIKTWMHPYPPPKPTEILPGDPYDDFSVMNELKSRCWFLIDSLPENEEMEKHIREIDKQLQVIIDDWNKLNEAAGRGEQIREQNISLIRQTSLLHMDLDSFSDRVTKLADAEYDKAEHRFRVATTVSYYTYGFGWLLTFLRGLFGTTRPEFE